MEFALDDTQQSVRELAIEVLTREQERAGGEHDHETGSRAIWKAMAAAGLLSVAVPERFGGGGLGPLATGVLLTEVGRRAAEVPALATLAFGVLPIARHGTEQQQERLLRDVDAGRVLTAALNEPSHALPDRPRTTARQDGDALVVTGTKTDVLCAEEAAEILVPVSLDDGGTAIALVRPDAAGLERRSCALSGGRAATLRFTEVRGERLGGERVGGGGVGDGGALADLHRCALAGMCALGDGAVRGALELTTEHVRTRTQFGRPLAAFQAVAGQIADVYVTARTLHLAALSACWRLGEVREPSEHREPHEHREPSAHWDPDEDLAVAALWLAEEAPAAMHTCHHLHGGIGVDATYPMHRHYSLVKDLARLLGGASGRVDALAGRIAG